MSLKISIIENELCDDCGLKTEEPLLNLKTRCKEAGLIQLWLHVSCAEKALAKAKRMIATLEACKGKPS